MKITIKTDAAAEDTLVEITCSQLSPEIEKIAAILRMMDKQLTGKREGQIELVPVHHVIYIESVDRKCFLYTDTSCFESDFKLYELEEQLHSSGFFRISKSLLINLQEVKSIRSEYNRRLLVTMCNGEQIIASRKYAEQLKKRLGVK